MLHICTKILRYIYINALLGLVVSHVLLFVTPWTVARQAHLTMGFPK